MDYWAKAPRPRDQFTLFSPTLDETIAEDHPVRVFDEILRTYDWSEWKAEYVSVATRRGQPPIPPRVIAGVILYGLARGLRSSRMLEYICKNGVDYIWLTEGRTLDHTTIAKFRTRFAEPLKDLFRFIGRMAMTMGLVRLGEIALDGTRVKANNGRFATTTAAGIEAKLKALDERFAEMLAEADRTDREESLLYATSESAEQLPPHLADLQARQAQLTAALAKLREADEQRRSQGKDPQKNPAQLPTTDPDSKVMPNKEGGYAPNYTPLTTIDTHGDYIVDAEVVAEPNEHTETVASVDRVEERFGERPDRVLADSAHATGANMEEFEEREIEFFTPVASNQPSRDNPAKRDDPTSPVAESDRDRLPRNGQKRLAKSAFVYIAAADEYRCPMGRRLKFDKTYSRQRQGKRVRTRMYRCVDCEGCSLADGCRSAGVRRRTIHRDQYENVRERTAARMSTAEGKQTYHRRFHAAEAPFGILKSVMGMRRFLLRGLPKVKTEWLWACTGYNIKKLVNDVVRLRAKFEKLAAEG